MARNRLRDAALNYARLLGVPVFPVHGIAGRLCTCGDPQCGSPGKHPHTPRGLLDASADAGQINDWWNRWPDANVAMPTGEPSGWFVWDVDLPAGPESLAALVQAHQALPACPVSITGSGGQQLFFAYPGEPEIRNSAGKLGVNLDVRGNGGYVVLPPSRHVTGRLYRWQPDARIDATGPVDAPGWLIEMAGAAHTGEAVEYPETAIPEGQRNDRLYRLARSLKAKRLSQPAVRAAVLAENHAKCSPPLPDGEVDAIVANAFRQPHRVDFESKARSEEKQIYHATDPMAIARGFATRKVDGAQGRICHRWDGRFWYWTGADYRGVEDEDIRAELWRYLSDESILLNSDASPTTPSGRCLSDAIDALKAHLNITRHALNPPQWIGASPVAAEVRLVSTMNGLLELRSGNLLPASPRFFNRNHIHASYAAEAACPEWLKFLDSLWPDEPAQIETLQEMFGYLITGQMEQQKIFMIIGPPRSGKGTIGQVIEALLGSDNVARIRAVEFVGAFGAEPLIDKTLAIVSDARFETGPAAGGMIEMLMAISGEDSIDVNRKHRSYWHGKLRTRFLILTNELPRILDASGALPTRLIVLATRKSFLGEEDFGLAERLKTELSGILNWAIAGWWRLAERGHLLQPPSVQELVEQFKSLTSPLRDFVDERCDLEIESQCELTALYDEYKDWCEHQGNKFPSAPNTFARDLRALYPSLTYLRKRDPMLGRRQLIGGLALKMHRSGLLGSAN